MNYVNEVMLIAGILCLIAGLIGCVVPFLIGPLLSFAGLLLLHFSTYGEFSNTFLVIMGALALAASVTDNLLPIIGVKNYGGSKRAVTGSVLGLFVGMFVLPPLGILIFPFFGALIAELTTGRKFLESLKSSFGAFAGLMMGLIFKLAVSGACVYYFAKELLKYFG